MCYSARIIQDYRYYVRAFGAQIGIKEFVDLFWRRRSDPKIKIPKAMEAAFVGLEGEEGSRILAMIEEFKKSHPYGEKPLGGSAPQPPTGARPPAAART